MLRYTLHEKLGDGGYGSVYMGRDPIGIRYAIKVLPRNKNKRDRVQNEVEVMKALVQSTRVPRFIEACEDDESFYIIQEWCKGGALKQYFSSKDLYGENTVASIIRGVLRGLCHIHDRNIIHRDIKGSNIMLADPSDDAEVRLIDFGAAIWCKSETIECGDMIGTPWFMSPEGLGHTFTFKSDVWSVGVLTYQLLSGKMPFNDIHNPTNPSLNIIFRMIFTHDPTYDSSVWTDISQDAKDFISKCLNKDYTQRPSSIEALNHPWLTKTDCNDRFTGTPLVCSPFNFDDGTIMHARTMINI